MPVFLHEAQYIRLDLFPCRVTKTGDESALPAKEYRVIATDNRLYVLIDSPEGPDALVNEALTDFSGDYNSGFTVTTTESVYTVERELNCGCGSRLRGYHPFLFVPHISRYPNGVQ